MGLAPNTILSGPRVALLSTGDNSPVGEAEICAAQGGGSATWPSANRAIYVPLLIESTVTVYQMWTYNGTAVAGNVDVGLYNAYGTRLVSSGATAQTGTSTIQTYDIADTTLTPGVYYMALMSTSASATMWRTTTNFLILRAAGVRQEATGGTLPATATFADVGSSYFPTFGATAVATL